MTQLLIKPQKPSRVMACRDGRKGAPLPALWARRMNDQLHLRARDLAC
jgi:hypothetical protein